jgi:hypothetical protein
LKFLNVGGTTIRLDSVLYILEVANGSLVITENGKNKTSREFSSLTSSLIQRGFGKVTLLKEVLSPSLAIEDDGLPINALINLNNVIGFEDGIQGWIVFTDLRRLKSSLDYTAMLEILNVELV